MVQRTLNTSEAKNKAWFGIEESFKAMDRVWTILSESSQFAHEQLERMKQNYADPEWDQDDVPLLNMIQRSVVQFS